jgi:hypothetical protein
LNNGIFVVYFVILYVVIITQVRSRRQIMRKIIKKKKSRNRGNLIMNEAIKIFLGKECVVYTFENTSVKGVVEAAEDGWLRIKTKKGQQLVNPDFVSRIREV